MILLPPGSSSTIRFPPLLGMIRLSLLGRVITCDGDGPTSTVRTTAPVSRSRTDILLENQWLA
jgi:hypothetical protein